MSRRNLTLTTSLSKRRPRFRRVKTRGFRITERDLAIVKAVYEHRLLDSNHIAALFADASAQQVRRRLQLLYHARYLDRPRVQLADLYRQPGTRPMVYGLGDKGAELLAEHLGRNRSGVSWTAKNRAIRPRFFHHTLLVSSVMVAFEISCRRHGTVRIIPWSEILETTCPQRTSELKQPQTWRVPLSGRGSIGITPDAIFGLHYLDRPKGKNRSYFFLEADRGTMTVVAKSLRTTSFFRKLLTYHATYMQQFHTKRFGFKAFRVLTVTSSAERVRSLVGATKELEGLQGIFLFTHRRALKSGDVLELGWTDGRAQRSRLMG